MKTGSYCEIHLLMNQYWQQLIITLPQSDALTLAEWLEEYALSVSMQDAVDEALFQEQPDTMPLWQHVEIEALFAEKDNKATELVELIKLKYPHSQCTLKLLAEQDWVRLTQSQFPPQCFADRLWIFPSWEIIPPQLSRVVRIDPGLAFGTGTHPTTTLCLSWLGQQRLDNKTCIDFGCGSGILALSALALGAKKVWAIDHDPQALQATHNNAQLNSSFDEEALVIADDINQLPETPVDIVIANILAKPLIKLSSRLTQLTQPHTGYLILSGLLQTEQTQVIAAYQDHFELEDVQEKENWLCLILKKK